MYLGKHKKVTKCADCGSPKSRNARYHKWCKACGDRHHPTIPIADRFFKKIKKTKTCWIWDSKSKNEHGYGVIWNKEKGHTIKAHRFSYEYHIGEIPPRMEILHTCDNPACVNPNHLRVGTRQDNVSDSMSKGRVRKGEEHGMAKLKWKDIPQIKEMYSTGNFSYKKLGIIFKVHFNTIREVIKNKRWVHSC
jgi:hypothetical protein